METVNALRRDNKDFTRNQRSRRRRRDTMATSAYHHSHAHGRMRMLGLPDTRRKIQEIQARVAHHYRRNQE